MNRCAPCSGMAAEARFYMEWPAGFLSMHPDLFVKMGDFEVQVFLERTEKHGWLRTRTLAVMAAVSLVQR